MRFPFSCLRIKDSFALMFTNINLIFKQLLQTAVPRIKSSVSVCLQACKKVAQCTFYVEVLL